MHRASVNLRYDLRHSRSNHVVRFLSRAHPPALRERGGLKEVVEIKRHRAAAPTNRRRRVGRNESSLPLTLSRPPWRRSPAPQGLTGAFAERPVVTPGVSAAAPAPKLRRLQVPLPAGAETLRCQTHPRRSQNRNAASRAKIGLRLEPHQELCRNRVQGLLTSAMFGPGFTHLD